MRGARLLDDPVDVQPFEDLLPAHHAGSQARVAALTKRWRWSISAAGGIETLRAQQRTAVILGLGGVLQLRELWARQPSGSEGNRPAGTGAGGSLAGSDLARASVTFTFNGTGVDCFTVRDRRQGRGAIPYVDGCSCARSTTTRRIQPMTRAARSPGSRTACTCCGSSSTAGPARGEGEARFVVTA